MSKSEDEPLMVEDFLAKEREKLREDRNTINLIFTILKDEQQVCSNSFDDGDVKYIDEEVVEDVDVSAHDEQVQFGSSKTLKAYNSQTEKERLALLFENAPNFLNLRYAGPRKHRYSENDHFSSVNKENRDPTCSCRLRSKTLTPKYKTGQIEKQTNNAIQDMVRVGEFSPLNPASNSSDRTLFGIGEYEERRRAFLEKKKREYLEYLANVKKNKKLHRSPSAGSTYEGNVDDGYVSHSENLSSREGSKLGRKIFTQRGDLIEDVDLDHCYTRMRQENYRKELDKQIEEKERLERERRNRERLECQKNQGNDVKHRREVMKRIEDDFNRRLEVLNECKRKHEAGKRNQSHDQNTSSNQTEEPRNNPNGRTSAYTIHKPRSYQSTDHFAKQNIETCSIENVNAYDKMKKELYRRELNKQVEESRQLKEQSGKNEDHRKQHQTDAETNAQVPHYLGNPFMKQSAESWTIDNLEEYQRLKDELYKKELDKQIIEKRKLEAERKAKAEEADRRLEEKFRRDAERRLIEEDKREGKLKNNQTSQKVKTDASELRKDEKEDAETKKFPTNSIVRVKNVSSIDHKLNEKSIVKNVSFAPRTYVYSIDERKNSPRAPSTEGISRKCGNESIIIEAPYVLAVKNMTNSININGDCDRRKPVSPISPDHIPIPPPGIKEPLPEIGKLPIPSAVSMSEQAVREYFKTNAFSDLSQIRKILRERQARLN